MTKEERGNLAGSVVDREFKFYPARHIRALYLMRFLVEVAFLLSYLACTGKELALRLLDFGGAGRI